VTLYRKSLQTFDQFSRMMYRLKAQILHFILVTVARQPDKYVLDNRARKLTCHPGRNETYPVPNSRAHGGAMRLNELNLNAGP
jgi:hypothetical protein